MRDLICLLRSQDGDWEGIYINGKLIDEGHSLGEGKSEEYWMEIGRKYNGELIIEELKDKDNKMVMINGSLPSNLNDFMDC